MSGQVGAGNTVHNERVRLVATMLNNIALAFIVAGFVAPIAGGHFQGGWHVVVTFAWVATGLVIHGAAHYALGRLRQ
jgi:hypothetical protein